jgi:hypothetical protein
MRERDVETYLVNQCAKRGWLCEKFTSPGKAGVPDRLILCPGGYACFAEVKAPGEKPRPLQLCDHQERRALGFCVFIPDTKQAVDETIACIERTLNES